MRRRELFPVDRGLQARMVLTAVLTPLVVLAMVALVAWLLPTKLLIGLGAVTVFGLVTALRERRDRADARVLTPGQEPALQAIVDRLCVAADLQRPEIAVDEERQPNSWIVDAPGRVPRLHVTRGLLDLLEPAELEAVVAHELSHVVHHDASVMTIVALPGAALLRGGTSNMGFSVPVLAARMVSVAIGS